MYTVNIITGKDIALCPHLQTGRFAEVMHLKETACCTLPPPHLMNDPRPKKRLSHSSHAANLHSL